MPDPFAPPEWASGSRQEQLAQWLADAPRNQTGQEFYSELGNRSIYQALLEGANVTQGANAGQDRQRQLLRGEFDRANQPTLTDQDIQRQFGAAADQATTDAQQLLRTLRSRIGESGSRGGAVAGLGAQVELQRLGQLTGARRDLTLAKAQADAQDRINRWQRAFALGEVEAQEPSPFLADMLASLSGLRVTQEGLAIQQGAATEAARAQRRAGESSMFGGILGGLGGLASGLF